MANRRYIDFPIASTSGDTDIILIWQDGANKQTTKATFLSGLPENLEDLNDVAISGLTNGQILRYDSVTGKWENTDQGNLDLNDLNDVSIVSPSNGQVLVYNSSTSKWENSSGGYVPYTGAVTTVNLGAQQLIAGQTTITTNGSADTLTVNHTSGSGKAINVTKGGNGEGLYVNKTSGSGNAATIVGTLEATTLVKTGGTSSQFLKADGSVDSTSYGTGTVTSVGLSSATSGVTIGSSPVTTSGTITLTIATASGSQNGLLSSSDWTTFNGKQNALTNPVTGTGTSGQVSYFTGTTTITSESNLFWDATNDRLGVGTNTPGARFEVKSTTESEIGGIRLMRTSAAQPMVVLHDQTGDGTISLYSGTNKTIQIDSAPSRPTYFNAGNLLIGTNTDNGAKLQVSGTANFSGSLTTGGQTSVLYNGYDSNVEGLRLGFDTSYYHAISATFSSSSVNNKMNFVVNSGNGTRAIGMTLQGNGSVGIGTTTPDVTGFGWKTLTIRGGTTSGEAGVLELQSPTTTGAANLGIIAFMDGSNRNAQIGVQRDVSTSTSNMFFYTNAGAGILERMQIKSSGAISVNSGRTDYHIVSIKSNSTNTYGGFGVYSSSNDRFISMNHTGTEGFIETENAGSGVMTPLTLKTGGAPRLTITSSGNVLIGTTTDNGKKLQVSGDVEVRNFGTSQTGVVVLSPNNYTSGGFVHPSLSTASTSWYHFIGQSGNGSSITTNNILIFGNGNVQNTNNSYGGFSDIKLKENITDASPKLVDLLKVKIRNYNFIGQETKQIGVIAQELEKIFPAMIEETLDRDKNGNDLLTTTKSVKYSVFVPMLIKAIQELKQEIDTLKN